MTDEQITTISREYAEEVYRNAHKEMEVLPNCLSNEAINMFAEDMESKLKWLLRRFCLVEKSKIQEEYQKAQAHIKDGKEFDVHVFVTIGASKESLLESLFPDLGKEVEG